MQGENIEEKSYDELIDELTARERKEMEGMTMEQLIDRVAESRAHIRHIYGLLNFSGKAIGQTLSIVNEFIRAASAIGVADVSEAQREEINKLGAFVISEAKKNIC